MRNISVVDLGYANCKIQAIIKRIVQDEFTTTGDIQNILKVLSRGDFKTYHLTRRKNESIYLELADPKMLKPALLIIHDNYFVT